MDDWYSYEHPGGKGAFHWGDVRGLLATDEGYEQWCMDVNLCGGSALRLRYRTKEARDTMYQQWVEVWQAWRGGLHDT